MIQHGMNGVWWPDGRPYHIEQCLKTVGRRGNVVLMHFYGRDDASQSVWRDYENEGVYVKCRHGWGPQGIPPAPERHILIRAYLDKSFGWNASGAWKTDPVWWAEHIVEHLSRFESPNGHFVNLWEDPFVTVYFANEPNLHVEHNDIAGNQWKYCSQDAYERIARWHLTVFSRVDELLGNSREARIGTSPFAHGHDPHTVSNPAYAVPDGEYLIPAVQEMMFHPIVSQVMANFYAHGRDKNTVVGDARWFHLWRSLRPHRWKNENEEGVVQEDPGGLITQLRRHRDAGKDIPLVCIAECGFFDHESSSPETARWYVDNYIELLDALAQTKVCTGANLFIWNSASTHSGNRIAPNAAMRNALEQATKIQTMMDWPSARRGGAEPAPPPPAPAPSLAADYVGHRLESGDNLWRLSVERYGTGGRWREFYRAVPMGDVTSLPIGTTIFMPRE